MSFEQSAQSSQCDSIWSRVISQLEDETGYDYVKLCQEWHDGQWSAFYKMQCNGRILDAEHAWDVRQECAHIVENTKHDSSDTEDYDAFRLLIIVVDSILNNLPEQEESL
jgi:hypothetical protein